MRRHFIGGFNGVELSVAEVGPREAPPIVLIHGWSQHHLCWSKQLGGPLAERFRLITPDLRGHGASDKPDAPGAYEHTGAWAGDLAAIIDALALTRPILVGWSMGGWVVSSYLRHYGDRDLAGIVMIGTSARTGDHMDPGVASARDPDVQAIGMYSADQAEALPATLAFVKACFHRQPGADDLALLVGMNMLCPPHIRRACRLRSEDYRAELASIIRPALVIQGAEERVCLHPIFEEVCRAIPQSRALIYDNCGHAPFWEDAARFDADLAEFAAHAWEAA